MGERAATINAPTPLDVMIDQLNANAPPGMTCQVKRRCADGSLVDASANQLSTLSTKSRVVTAAQALKDVPPTERTAWAIEMKDYANELYANHQIRDAMEKYVEALAASDFGGGENLQADVSCPTSDNINVLIIPILCNLAACCIQLKEYSKSLQFSNQALKLRPNCGKALMRRGMSLLHNGEFQMAIVDLERALEISDPDNVVLPITEADRQRIPILIHKAQQGLESEAKSLARQKRSLEKHFKPLSKPTHQDTHQQPVPQKQSTVPTLHIYNLLTRLLAWILAFLGVQRA